MILQFKNKFINTKEIIQVGNIDYNGWAHPFFHILLKNGNCISINDDYADAKEVLEFHSNLMSLF